MKCKYKGCSREIPIANIHQHEKGCMYNPDNYNECKQCDKHIHHRNKFCGSSCAATYNNNLARAPKRKKTGKYTNCLNCNEEFYYLPSRSFGKYCSIKCQHEYQRKQVHNTIETEGVEALSKWEPTQRVILKRYLIDKYGAKCMKCGWDEVNKWTGIVPVQIDHIDGNGHNQDLNNIHLLCPSCHSLTEFYGARGHGRKHLQRAQIMTKKDYLESLEEDE